MEFDPLCARLGHLPGGLHHILLCFSRQAQNQVGHGLQPRSMEALHRVKINPCIIAPVHGPGGFLMDRLKAQLHADVFLLRQFR